MFDSFEKLKDYLKARQLAYKRTFDPEIPEARRVLKDLAKFCRANESTFKEDVRHHALLEGRREVWLRIMEHLKMPTQEFLDKHGGKESNEYSS